MRGRDPAGRGAAARDLLASTRIFADETVVPVLDPGRGRTKKPFAARALRVRPLTVPSTVAPLTQVRLVNQRSWKNSVWELPGKIISPARSSAINASMAAKRPWAIAQKSETQRS